MKKFIFIEPYASLGGHMWRNVNYLQSAIHTQGVPYRFIAERDVVMPDCGCVQQILSSRAELDRLSAVDKTAMRVNEYKGLFKEEEPSTFIFLTNYAFEFDVWPALLRDSAWRRTIQRRDHQVVVHITALSLKLFRLFEECRTELHELKETVFFSFFSELQPLIIKEYARYNNCFTLFQAGYEEFSCIGKPERNCKQFLSYLGFYNWSKNPHTVFDVFQKKQRKIPFHVHFYPKGKQNSLLAAAFQDAKREDDRIDFRCLSAHEYTEAIFCSKIGLLPYDSYNYAVQASGLLEEYLFAGVPVIVPQDSWLSYLLSVFGGGGLTFDPNKTRDFERAINDVLAAYDMHSRRAQNAAKRIAEKRSISNYLSILRSLREDRVCADLIDLGEPQTYEKAVQKGIAYHFARFAEEEYENKNISKAWEYLSVAENADKDFWEIAFLKHVLERSVKDCEAVHFLKGSLHSGREFNPYRLLEKLEKYCMSVEDEPSIKLMIEMICTHDLATMMSFLQLYRTASLSRQVKRYDVAEKWFLQIAACDDLHLRSGALFHLGEMQFAERQWDRARNYLNMCLDINKTHMQARILLNTLSKKETGLEYV
jgi:glycosyltransferase involved in cell wall biosynthesis